MSWGSCAGGRAEARRCFDIECLCDVGVDSGHRMTEVAMSDSSLLDAGVRPFAAGDATIAWAESLRSAPWFIQYAIAVALVGLAVAVGFGLQHVITPANLTLVFVLPVVISATSFGWGPSLAAVAVGVLAFDYFFTEPYFQFTIAS